MELLGGLAAAVPVPEALAAFDGVSAGTLAAMVGAGVAMGVAPSSYPLYSMVAGLAAGHGPRSPRRSAALPLAFVLGTATSDAAMGALSGSLGGLAFTVIARRVVLWNLLAAGLLALFGLALLRQVRIRWPAPRRTWRMTDSAAGAYVLGIPFGLTTCPSCSPVVLPLLAGVGATGSWWLGAAAMFLFGLARGAPLLVLGAGASAVARLEERSLRWSTRLERGGGVVLLLASLYFLAKALRSVWLA